VQQKISASYANLSLSPQWILDCDTTDMGCGGGLLDDAWRFLEAKGVVDETCDPYLYCAHPVSPSCETGPHPPRPTPSQHSCPTACNTSALSRQYKAASAYAVAKPGDVASIQREIMVSMRATHSTADTRHSTLAHQHRTPRTYGICLGSQPIHTLGPWPHSSGLPSILRLHDLPQRHVLPHTISQGPRGGTRRQNGGVGGGRSESPVLDRGKQVGCEYECMEIWSNIECTYSPPPVYIALYRLHVNAIAVMTKRAVSVCVCAVLLRSLLQLESYVGRLQRLLPYPQGNK
jgi:hypothetical protein